MSQIIFEYNDRMYTLEFDKDTATRIERRGFDITKLGNESLTQVPLLIQGAFIKHHPYEKANRIDEIIKALGKKSELINKLAEMYVEPINELFGVDEDGDDSKKVQWELIP